MFMDHNLSGLHNCKSWSAWPFSATLKRMGHLLLCVALCHCGLVFTALPSEAAGKASRFSGALVTSWLLLLWESCCFSGICTKLELDLTFLSKLHLADTKNQCCFLLWKECLQVKSKEAGVRQRQGWVDLCMGRERLNFWVRIVYHFRGKRNTFMSIL